jgi:hypothetical protein
MSMNVWGVLASAKDDSVGLESAPVESWSKEAVAISRGAIRWESFGWEAIRRGKDGGEGWRSREKEGKEAVGLYAGGPS